MGSKDLIENKPIIGDYVSVGSGSKALGKINIGTNVLVAPNAVVTKDIPDNVTVGGIPAKVISEKGLWNLTKGIKLSEEKCSTNSDKQLRDDMSIIMIFKPLLRNE